MAELLSLAEAQAAVLDRVQPLSTEEVPVAAAAGRFLADAARAAVDLPPFDASAMDGFAVRASDTPGRLPVVAHVAAGVPVTAELKAGQAIGIATGGVVPAGADAVVPIENVVQSDNKIEIAAVARAGAHIRPRGGDLRAGDVVVEPGVRLTPAQIGALAAAGCPIVACARRPRVAVLSTGTELRSPGEPLGPGQVYEANSAMLAAALEAANGDVTVVPVATDDLAEHRAALERALEADVVVTSGGVSVGPHDLVRAVAQELGVEEVFWRVAVKPGKPVSFGVRNRTLVFGLPGNPVSSLVGCELFVRPALHALQGAGEPGPTYDVARLSSTVHRNPKRDEFLRARLVRNGDAIELDAIVGQESHMIARAASADALIVVPRGQGEIAAGSPASFLRLR